MKLKYFTLIWLFAAALSVEAQIMGRVGDNGEQNIYRSGSGRVRSPQEVQAMRTLINARRANAGFAALESFRNGPTYSVTVSRSSAELMTKARKYVAPALEYQTRYAEFLKTPGTGLVRLLAPTPCLAASGSDKKAKFSEILERCAPDFISGNGRYFSFRRGDYVDYNWADIGYRDKWLFSYGTLNQGVLAALGNVPLEDVSLAGRGVEYLAAYDPAPSLEGAARETEQFENGIEVNGVKFGKVVAAEKDVTYILRVVAYDPYIRTVEKKGKKDTQTTDVFLFDDDRREDVLVAFRIVEKSADGGLTLLWKELKRADSPKLLIPVH